MEIIIIVLLVIILIMLWNKNSQHDMKLEGIKRMIEESRKEILKDMYENDEEVRRELGILDNKLRGQFGVDWD